MNSREPLTRDSDQRRLKSVKGLMLGRVLILTLLLTITLLFQVSEKRYFFIPLTNAFYYFIGFFYLVTIVYALALRRISDLDRFLFFQLIVDHLFIAGLIYFTGGKQSFFPLVYFFTIIGSSIFFFRRGAYLSALVSTLLYGLLLLFQLYQWITPPGFSQAYEASQIFYSLVIYMASFFIVAHLSSSIAEELRKKGKELSQKQVDYRQLETFNRNVIRSLDSGLLTVDLQGRINFLNPTAERILGLTEDGTRGVSLYGLFPALGRITGDMAKKPAHASSDYERYETQFIDPQGRRVHLGFSISLLTGPDGSLIGHTLIFQDITRFREMEEEMKRLDKMAAISQLAAGMAHEIRNPLTSLSGSIQMLKSELALKAHQERLMNIILRESERLNALITDFLLFAQPPRTNKGVWNIWSLLEEMVELFRHSPEYPEGLEIRCADHREEIRLLLDADQMKQVFWNLFLNAIQAMDEKGTLTVGIERRTDGLSHRKGTEWVTVSISDSGKGMSPQEKEKIFEPFYTTKDGGTGLGLSIVHRIVENHEGIIKVDSEVGKGSTFTILLPVLQEEKREC